MPPPSEIPPGRGAIFRDDFGIPHLWADRVDDLSYVQGYEAAYERAWQLEYGRLRAEGRTAAILGRTQVQWDVFARRARLVETARRAFDKLDGRTRAWCTAYVEGVNDALPAGAAGSAEFSALTVAPGRWQAWTPLAVFAGIHILFGTCQYKLWREHVAAVLGPDLMAEFGLEGDAPGGSNAFAVTGPRSPTGLPVIAGDPHRNLEVPNVYQQIRLACPAFDVVGLAFPGVPGIAHFGHAGSVAWATTNAMADYQDLYVERLRRDPATGLLMARGPQGWEPVTADDVERIEIRDGTPVEIRAVQTARGPVVLGDAADARGTASGADATYSLRTPSRVELDLGFGALLPLLHARTIADVEAAMALWVEPVNAVVIADAEGRLRQLVVGLVPDRSAANRVLPADAALAAAAWTGRYLHPDGVDSDVVVNANDRGSGAGLGFDYAPASRARRIRRLVESGAAFDRAGLAAVSLDTEQPAVVTMRGLVGAVGQQEVEGSAPEHTRTAWMPGTVAPGSLAARVRDQLLDWDGRADAENHGAALFAAWRAALVGWLLHQPPLAPLASTPGYLPAFLARWLDPVIRVGAVWEQLVLAGDRLGLDVPTGVRLALEQVADNPPTKPWGAVHLFAPLHPLTGRPGAPDLPTTALAGDAGCVLATRSFPGLTDVCSFGPVARYTWDLSDRERSRWVVPLGASARADSPHRVDQLERWSRGETIPVITSWDQLLLERTLPLR